MVVRADVLAAVGGPEPVRAGGLADLIVRLAEAGHGVEARPVAVAARRATPAALLREGAGRFWLFRRHPGRHPLPRPREVGVLRWPLLALGALRRTLKGSGGAARSEVVGAQEVELERRPRQNASASMLSTTDFSYASTSSARPAAWRLSSSASSSGCSVPAST